MNDLLTTFAEFHFIRPQWLWAILPLLVLGGLLAYLNKQQSGWQSVLAGHLYKHIVSHAGGKKLRKPLGLLTLGWIIATLALAGPTWQRLPQPVFQLHSGKVVLLDMSMSMRATDIKPNRLTRAKYKAIDLVKQIAEGETGLVAYAGDAFTISPLSSDGQNLTTLIPSLSPEIMPIAGSEPALGLQAAIALLQNANYPQGEIFWITDGIDNLQMKEMSELLNASPYRLSILAVGTEEGAPIQMQNGELLKDNSGSIVLPKLTPSNLKTLARQGGGRYAPMQADNSDIEYLVDQSTLGTDEQQADEADNNFGDKWQEMGPYLLLFLLPFAAYSFRRGLLGVVLLSLLLPIYTPEASASTLQDSVQEAWQNMWHTKDQQGLAAFEKQQFDEAAQKFDDPLWQGSALYKNQDYENALKAFNKVDSAQGRYNQANTLAQLGKLPEAIKKYDEVLKQQPDNEDAKANKALVEKLLEQQKSEQQKSDQNQQQDSDQQQKSDEQQEQQDQEGDQSEQQNSDQQQQQQNDSQGDSSEQEQSEQDKQQQQAEAEQEQSEEQQEQAAEDKEAQEGEEGEQEAQTQQMQEKELTDEEKEQMQRMQNLLNKVPDDPAFLLKRKMQIEAQQRKRERAPGNLQRNW